MKNSMIALGVTTFIFLVWYDTYCYYWAIQWLVIEPFKLPIQLSMWHVLGLLYLIRTIIITNPKDYLLQARLKSLMSKEDIQMCEVKNFLTYFGKVTMLLGVAYLLKDMI